MRGRLWLIALCLYAAAGLADMAYHLRAESTAGRDWHSPSSAIVAFSAGLFWPADVIASLLLAR